jgi:Ni/Co efflux regulator RcnB
MKMLMATRVAAVVGLSLVSGMALAAPDGRRGNNDNAVAEDQKRGNQDARDRSRRGTKPVVVPAPRANPAYPGLRESNARNERQRRGVERARNRSENVRNTHGRNNQVNDRARDNRRNFGDRADRRALGDRARDGRRYYGDRNDRPGWGDRNRRQHIDVQRYHRNFNSPRRYRAEVYRWRDGSSYRRYGYGQRLPRHYFIRNFWIANFFSYDLFAPPPGYIWVRYGPDALLVDQYTGEIVQVRYGVFYS